jgi:hypothetical protein
MYETIDNIIVIKENIITVDQSAPLTLVGGFFCFQIVSSAMNILGSLGFSVLYLLTSVFSLMRKHAGKEKVSFFVGKTTDFPEGHRDDVVRRDVKLGGISIKPKNW